MFNKVITTQTQRGNLFLSLTTKLSLFAGILLASYVASAQTLQLRFLFDDTGPGTTTTSDASGALGTGVTVFMETATAGTSTDLHGAANSGIQSQGRGLDFSGNAEINTAGNVPGLIAFTNNCTAMGAMGLVSNFTATIWFKMVKDPTNTANFGPRLFILGTNGVTDTGNGNSIGMLINTQPGQLTNAIAARINGTQLAMPLYNSIPTNVWQFVALVYDATAGNALIYYGTEASPAKLRMVNNIGVQTIDFTGSGNLQFGNRLNARTRPLKGWLDDFRFYTGVADAAFIESIRQASTPVVVSSLYPDGSTLLEGTNQLTFTASSASGIDPSGIKVTVDGTDVSGSLVIGPTATSRTVSYTGLPVDKTLINNSHLNNVDINIRITDIAGIVTSNTISYDCFSPNHFTWEAEDYNFTTNGVPGAYINNPRYAFENTAGTTEDTYWQRAGTPPIDYSDGNANGTHVFRDPADLMATEFSVGGAVNGGINLGELMRQKVLDAYALSNIVREVDIGNFDTGNWTDYTRNFPTGLFNVYARSAYGTTGPGTVILSMVTNGAGTAVQLTNNLGTFTFPNTDGWETYSWVPLRDTQGNLARVSLNGLSTLQAYAGSGGGGNQNFFMLINANTNLPSIVDIYPNAGGEPSGTFTFTARSLAGITINPGSIKLTLSGVPLSGNSFTTNLTSANGLVITGTATNRIVVYPGIQTNVSYTAVISVTDTAGSPGGQTVNFDTFNPILTWEGEDYNYGDGSTTGGLFIDNPQTNGYANTVGTPEIDFHKSVAEGTRAYREIGVTIAPATEPNGDTARAAYSGIGFTDYDLGWYENGDWVNYTRTIPAGEYNVYLRAANGSASPGSLTLSRVGGNPTTTSQTTTNLGTFAIPVTAGWQAYTLIPLRDAGGNLVKFIGGGVQTLRATSGGGLNANYYALFAANTNLPTINNIYPVNGKILQPTNRLSFSVASAAGISTASITVALNDSNVTPGLVITGSSTSRSVSYTGLQLNTAYVAVISVTDLNGNSATTTVSFDTWAFTYTWEAEDYDYGGGLFFDNPQTNAYAGLSNAVPEVDFHDVNGNTANAYRGSGGTDTGSTEGNGDLLRAPYFGTGLTDYDVGFFSPGAWDNYTRHYPAGTFNVYARLACGNIAGTSSGFSQVTGFGTDPQTTNFLGTFAVPGSAGAWQAYNYIPLRDGSGNLVTVTLNGSTNTFKVSNEGPQDLNMNFFMLVTVAPQVSLTASISGGNIHISFLSQTGFSYQVEYKNNLTDVGWTPLGSLVVGDGTTKTVNDPATGSGRFYHVKIQ